MNSSTRNAEQAVSFDFLVKVTGDKLELQYDLLQSLLVPYRDFKVPVAIVTVIGQPKSRKTLLTNYIQNCIIRLVDKKTKQIGTAVTPTSGFPRSLDDCPSRERDKLDGQEGVLIWTKPRLVQQYDGQPLAVFILDIWCENPSPSLYTRLVDFCITSSSIVILVEDCCTAKESNWNQWDISKSCLAQLKGREFQNLHVLIYADWRKENFYILGLEGGTLFRNTSKDHFSDRLSRVVDTRHILRRYFQDASYFLASSESTVQNVWSDSGYLSGLLEFSCKVVGTDRSKIFPLARNKTVLSTLSVNNHLHNGIVISNSAVAVTEATDPSTFQLNNTLVKMELGEDTKGSAAVQTPNQMESKNSSTDTQTDFEATEAAIKNKSFVVDETCMKGNTEVTSSFEDSTNSNSQSELDKSEAYQQNAYASEIKDGFIIIADKPTETASVSQASGLRSNIYDTGEEAMDQTEPFVKPLETSKVSVLELEHGDNLVVAYTMKLSTYIDNSSVTELFCKDEDLESLHLLFKGEIWGDFPSEFRGPQAEEFRETMNVQFDKIFTDFKHKYSENRRLYYLHYEEGEKNAKLKFDQIISNLRIKVLENPLEPLYDLRNDDLDNYYDVYTENIPGKLKNYFTLWYSCKSDKFKADLGFMEAMMKDYKKKMQMVLISSRCKNVTKKEVEEDNVLHSKIAEEMASNHKWSHKTLNDVAKEAIVVIQKTFSVCIDLTYRTLEVYKKGLQAFIDSHSNKDTLYFEDDELNSVHSKLKGRIEQSDVISQIPPSLVGDLLAKIKADCDEEFLAFVTKYSEERASFYNLLQQVKSKTKLKFDKEVAKLELQIKKDPSNILYDLKMANLNNYVKIILTQNVSDSKWKKYFISWYSHELDDFTKDVSATISAIQLYRDKFRSFFSENICVNENRFHEAHSIFSKLAERDNNHTWKNSRLKVLSGTGIELTRQSFNQLNLDIINKEEEMAKEASNFAEVHYNSLMKSQISERTFTDSEVKTFHETCVKTAVDSFRGVPQFKDAYVWDQYSNVLGYRLHIHLSNYLKENQQNVDRVQSTKQILMSDCTKAYNDSMNKLIADRVISDEVLLSHHRQSFREAFQILNGTMNSSTEKFDKSSWVKELEEKLRVHFNSFTVENDRFLKEARNHQPEAAASTDHGNVTSTQSCGVGIYFGPDIVRLGIYPNRQTNPKYLEFSPFVTFERNGIVFFNRDSSHYDHFHVYKTLVEEKSFPRTVFVFGKSYKLWNEEIVAVFLNKIKSEAETKFGFVLTSCSVAVSAFMSTSSKQMLKTALTLAGFERSTIMQSTTAVGLSYVVTNKVSRNGPAIFIHQAGSVFDVATALINQRSISIRSISGLPYLEKSSGLEYYISKWAKPDSQEDTLRKKVKQLISSTLASSGFSPGQLETMVMVQGNETFISDRSAITETLLCRSLNTLDETQGIVLGAAAFNAFQSKIPGAPNLEYNEVFPYTMIADVNGKQSLTVVRHNVTMPVTSKNMSNELAFTDVMEYARAVRITELAAEKEKVFVGEYTMYSMCRNFVLRVNFNHEGLIEVEASTTADSKALPLKISTKGLTMAQHVAAMENLRPILIPTAAPILPDVPVKSQEEKTNAGTVENEMTTPVVVAQDSKTKLVNLITEVKDRLAKSTATNPMIVTRINMVIKLCEELLGKDNNVEEIQIETHIKVLDLAAARIK